MTSSAPLPPPSGVPASTLPPPTGLPGSAPANPAIRRSEPVTTGATTTQASATAVLDPAPDEERKEAIQVYFGERINRRHRPGRALENAHYAFDLVCDYGIFRDLQRHRMVDDLRWQKLSPKLGYEVPDLVEEAGLTDRFEKNFKD